MSWQNEAEEQRRQRGQRALLLSSLAFIAAVTLSGFLAPLLSSYSPAGIQEGRILEGPSWSHWLGTDGLGRDLFTRILYGARVSLTVGIGTALIALIIVVLLGVAYLFMDQILAVFQGG